ncbi:MAG TPA: hypothetical protein PLI93_05135 [Gemmatimonadales bacterium]|nr:hypothetical protein [Gemmatimonadales bacterium]MCB9517578.1 hypothetical protein [Gemmatimonadales bacterium]HPF61429.1 hypothetical protein [Gemmatimonadales bacterium]HRX17681.1 hypothetical protein [Gemmatimonadales bacterium]
MPTQPPGPISLQDATRFVERARQADLLSILAWSYPSDLIRELCDQAGAGRVRLYLGVNDEDLPTIILLATDDAGKDMTSGIILDYAWPCPPECDSDSPLTRAP